jgi:hypothetical protein
MKRSQFLLLTILAFPAFSSCTHTLYTQQQVLQNCHKKQDVLEQFGPPDEINPGIGVEQWAYNMDKKPVKRSKKHDTTQILPDTLVKDSLQYVKQDKYASYAKFMFDSQGNLVGYKTDGADLSRNKKDNFGKSFVNITGVILVASVLVVLELYRTGAFDN